MKLLIAYYSHTGTTRRAAEALQKATGGDLYEIQERDAYPRPYHEVTKQAKQEIRSAYKPPLRNALPDISGYDILFIGSPNWWSSIAPPVATFLDTLDFTGKRMIPFITHGGGGLGHMVADIRALCPSVTVDEGIDANESSNITACVKSLREQ